MLLFDHNHHRRKRVFRIINTLYKDNVIFIIDIRLIKKFISLFNNNSLTFFDFDSKLCLVYIINIYKIHLTFFACDFKIMKSIQNHLEIMRVFSICCKKLLLSHFVLKKTFYKSCKLMFSHYTS